ncbi:hypothetical protein LCGC14_0326340 [marine sediment metagenome]|uniref:Thioredoxin-like fold domain-containing protein n=1 Tax=marine sediment metagenome TaxID=412755 RepID=A0A0F9U0M0_9ZZZZ
MKNKTPFLVYVGRHDCPACQVMEKELLPNLLVNGYEFSRVYHDTDRKRAMVALYGSKGPSLKQMQNDTLPQLILYMPYKSGLYLRCRLTPIPVSSKKG